ncbi:MAG: S41 family peptidase [bacterium]|nr:S41 family peptidase [bacterium]
MDKSKQNKAIKFIGGLIILLFVFFAGQYIGQKSSLSTPSTASIPVPEDINVTSDQFEPFWKVWRILSEKYVAATTTDSQERIWGAIQGLTASQGDPYTVFFPPEESAMFKSDISGNFEGVGMEIGQKDGILTVVAPLKNSPAELAGVKAGDKIIKIDGQTVTDLQVDKAVKLIRGPKGTPVKITFIRDGLNQQIERTIVRGVIDIPTIQTEIKEGKPTSGSATSTEGALGLRKDGIFVIRLFSFTSQASYLFQNALREFIQSGSHKLIIDLRGNPGGYLDAAWDMSSWFLPVGKVIVTEDFGGKNTNKIYRSKGYNIFGKDLDLIILVDAGSASASEIFAGALQEHGIAKLVGTKTFGKGSVQELIPITADTSLKVTIASWLTPNGHNLSQEGLTPDVEVKVTAKDIDSKTDAAMDKAVEILRKED